MKISLRRALVQRPQSELVELHDLWVGGKPSPHRKELVEALCQRMADPVTVQSVRTRLDEASHRVLSLLQSSSRPDGCPFEVLKQRALGQGIQAGPVRSALADLWAMGFAMPAPEGAAGPNGVPEAWVLPRELAFALKQTTSSSLSPAELLTLHGYLERQLGGNESDSNSQRARRMYRFLAGDSSICARIDELKETLVQPMHRLITEFGGLLPLSELDKLGGEGGRDVATLQKALEDNSLGSLGELDLESFGIRQRGQIIAVFNEVVMAYLRRAAKIDPVEPAAIASIGVDFVSNFSRFASFVGDQNVRFTVRGTIFKSTGKRIADTLIPNPGREFRRRDILDLEYRFALSFRLIDRTGERSFMLTREGQDFLRKPLLDKQRQMLDWLIEDRDLPGDLAHQLRLRRTTLRYLKRLEPGVWYDAMFLPFVARNHYLASLAMEQESLRDGNTFPVRSSADLQSLAWNLFTWIRKHLYLLGVIDLGYDASGRACAFRLTSMGAELLGVIPGRELEGAGHIVVNPDFEVVLFPEEHSHTLVYQLDRFCQRELTDSLYHYRITPGSLHRALSEGMDLNGIVDLLGRLSRTPLPQNVLFSLESWARSDGLVTYYDDGRLECDTPEILDRLQLHPELGRLGFERLSPGTLRLHGEAPQEDIGGWVRDFGVAFRVAS
ncbi:MAG: hypothetical protein DWQ01_12035 [Planctomycetota bacterium]|nr:MAG: hypothetical protein DWQ01_12035 [Planctomycetota bacterium]